MSTKVQRWTGAAEITMGDILNLRDGNDDDAARVLDERAEVLERNTRRSFIEIGMIALEMKERMLWTRRAHPETGVPYHSWDEWVMTRFGVSRSSAYSAVKVLRTLRSVPVDDLKDMPRRNVMHLASLSSTVSCHPRVIEQAKTLSEADFVAAVNESHPDQHIEASRALVFRPEESARQVVLDTMEMVAWAYEIENREDVLENVFAYFADGPCEREGYTGMSNREAYAAAQKAEE